MAESDAVFSGKVLRVTNRKAGKGNAEVFWKEVTIQTLQCWKGGIRGTVRLKTALDGAECGYHFTKGAQYLIYAGWNNDRILTTGLCGRTRWLKGADKEIMELEGRLPVPVGPSLAPTLELVGHRADDDQEYLFRLHNRLHDRIYYPSDESECIVQIWKNHRWVSVPWRHEDPWQDLPLFARRRAFSEWQEMLRLDHSDEYPLYLDRQTATTFRCSLPRGAVRWRVGMRFVTEPDFDRGVGMTKTKKMLWSEPIDASRPVRRVSEAEEDAIDQTE